MQVLSRSGDSFCSANRLRLALLLSSVYLLSACGSASGTDAASALKSSKANVNSNGGTSSPTPTPTPTTVTSAPSSTTAVIYDTSIGSGVDANGYANLPLRSGARRYFVSSAAGSDSNGCSGAQQPGTPMRSIGAAAACVQNNNGDQILVAEGTSYSEGLPNFDSRAGYSAVYPTVLQSYDPSDPTNESKYGRAANGRRPVVNTGAAQQQAVTCCTNTPASYLAIRGFDINPGNQPAMIVTFVGSNNYVLIENNIFRYTELSFDKYIFPQATSHIIRKNSFYGEWTTNGHIQGLYDSGTDNVVIEDNVFWHNGWKVGASRDDTIANGGMVGDDFFRHPIYQQTNSNSTVRRNLIVDGGSDGGQYRGNSTITENVYIDNPTSIAAGGGNDYNLNLPNGVNLQISYNAIFGSSEIDSAQPRSVAIGSSNGISGSAVHHNLIARSGIASTAQPAIVTAADYNQPSYMDIHDNRIYQWNSGYSNVFNGGSFPSQDFPTYENNIWDDPSSGSNVNNSGATFLNAYTASSLYSALGYADKTAFMNHAINYPEENPARTVRALLFTGYGMN